MKVDIGADPSPLEPVPGDVYHNVGGRVVVSHVTDTQVVWFNNGEERGASRAGFVALLASLQGMTAVGRIPMPAPPTPELPHSDLAWFRDQVCELVSEFRGAAPATILSAVAKMRRERDEAKREVERLKATSIHFKEH